MSTTVTLKVTLPYEIGPDRDVEVPTDILAALRDAGQPTGHGFYKSGDGPWRLHYQLTGPNRLSAGRSLQGKLTEMGYETDVSVTR